MDTKFRDLQRRAQSDPDARTELFYYVLRNGLVPERAWKNLIRLFSYLGDTQAKLIQKAIQEKPINNLKDFLYNRKNNTYGVGLHPAVCMFIGAAKATLNTIQNRIDLFEIATTARNLAFTRIYARQRERADSFVGHASDIIAFLEKFLKYATEDVEPVGGRWLKGRLVVSAPIAHEFDEVTVQHWIHEAINLSNNTNDLEVYGQGLNAFHYLFSGLTDILWGLYEAQAGQIPLVFRGFESFRLALYSLDYNQSQASSILREGMRQEVVPYAMFIAP